MPYNILVTSKIPHHDNIRLDLSEEELKKVISSYYEGKPVFCGGRELFPDNVERILVTYNDRDSSVLYPIIERELEEERRSRKLVKTIPIEWYIFTRGRDVTDRYITGLHRSSIEVKSSFSTLQQAKDPRKVWVVFGRNLKLREAIFTFLRSLDLHPIEWEESRGRTDEPTPYIGTVLETAFNEAQAFLIIISGDDEGRLRKEFQNDHDPIFETNLTPQARQNVIFEAGMAFGINSKRTILIELGEVRPFSDIYGRHVVRMNNSPEKRHILANRLESAGCIVDRSGEDWLKVGDFNVLPINSTISEEVLKEKAIEKPRINIYSCVHSYNISNNSSIIDITFDILNRNTTNKISINGINIIKLKGKDILGEVNYEGVFPPSGINPISEERLNYKFNLSNIILKEVEYDLVVAIWHSIGVEIIECKSHLNQ